MCKFLIEVSFLSLWEVIMFRICSFVRWNDDFIKFSCWRIGWLENEIMGFELWMRWMWMWFIFVGCIKG